MMPQCHLCLQCHPHTREAASRLDCLTHALLRKSERTQNMAGVCGVPLQSLMLLLLLCTFTTLQEVEDQDFLQDKNESADISAAAATTVSSETQQQPGAPRPAQPPEQQRDGQLLQSHGEPEQWNSEGAEEEEEEREVSEVVVVSLGGGDTMQVMAALTMLLGEHGHQVTVVVYGDHPDFSAAVQVVELEATDDDPLYTPASSSEAQASDEWLDGRTVSSHLSGCRKLQESKKVENLVSKAKVVVTPLFLHDLCTLGLAHRAGVPVLGVLTSRTGAWWVWQHLQASPELATTPVPPHLTLDTSLWGRLANLARHYGYMSWVRQHWQAPALALLQPQWSLPPLPQLYQHLAAVLVVWHPLLDPYLPYHPTVVPVGAFALQTGAMTKEVLVPALLNRAGLVAVVGSDTLGAATIQHLHQALRSKAFTVLWQGERPQDDPESPEGTTQARFIYKEKLPLIDVLNHPRHRLLISACGEMEAMAAVFYGSPVLCLPVTADQRMAAINLQDQGLGLVVTEPTAAALVKAITTLTSNRMYRTRGRLLAEELHDQPLSPNDRLLFVMERVLRKPHSPRYHSPGMDLQLIQKSNADVYLLLLLLLTLLVALLIFLAISFLPAVMKKQKKKTE